MRLFVRAVTLILSLFICQIAYGQAALLVLIFGDKVASEKFHLSIDMGVNYSSMPGLAKQEAKFNPYFGLGTFIKLNNKWAFTPEFKPVSGNGAKNVPAVTDYSSTITDAHYTLALRYLDIPLLIQYKITPRLFVSTGPQISFLGSATQQAEGKIPNGNSVNIEESVASSFNQQYYSIPVEVGYSLSNQRGGKGIDIKVRYNFGLTNMISNSSYGSTYGSTFNFFLSFPFINIPDNSVNK